MEVSLPVSNVIENIRQALQGNIDQQIKEGSRRFFKEKVNTYGLR